MVRDVAVVIPYFQQEAGILRRAVDSVASQTGVDLRRLALFVVDDCSPYPCEADLGSSWPLAIQVIKRPVNGGPGASRNSGLEALDDEVKYVAFLDSDDRWHDDHLAIGLRALEAGSFFFANFYQLGAVIPAFERAGRIRAVEHEPLFGDCYRYRGCMLDQIYLGNIIGTSTVIFRRDIHPTLRFETRFRRAGEDYLMWSAFAAAGASFVFRASPSVTYLRGVNVYSGVTYGTVQHLERTRDEIAYLRYAKRRFALAPRTRSAVRRRIRGLRYQYWRSFASLLMRHPSTLFARYRAR